MGETAQNLRTVSRGSQSNGQTRAGLRNFERLCRPRRRAKRGLRCRFSMSVD